MSVPKIRFCTDNGDQFPPYQTLKMSDIFTEVMQKNHPELPVLSVQQGKGTVLRDESGRNIQYGKDNLKNYKAMNKGDFIIHLRSFEGGLECSNYDGISSPAYRILRTEKLIPEAVKDYFRTPKFIDGKLAISVVGIRDGKNIDMPTFWEIEMDVPCLEEQRKIADFFSTLDEVIAQSEAEVAALEKQKKGVMQKIFSQEVRFKREDESDYPEWVESSFAEIFEGLNNNTFSRDMLNTISGPAKCIHYGDILVKYGHICDVCSVAIPYVNDGLSIQKYIKLKNGDVVFADTAEDDAVGKAIELQNIGSEPVISGLHTMACRPTKRFAPKYLGYYLNSSQFHSQLFSLMQGTKVSSISKKNMGTTKITFPSDFEEQERIAEMFSAMDDTISLAKQELEKWKLLKKGLLQQMFV